MTRAVLGTSLHPAADAEVQDAVVASWLDQGFTVISYNIAAEAECLSSRVTFHEPRRTATAKPLPLIGDIVANLSREAADLFGIVNTDIAFRGGTDLPRRLAPPLTRTLIAVTRTDVDGLTSLGNPSPVRGFDAFFFDPELATLLDERPFCIGMPNLDFWLPLAAHAAGWRLAAITAPVALHVRHDIRWSDKTLAFNHHLMRYLSSARLSPEETAAYEDLAFRALRDPTLSEDERAAMPEFQPVE